MRPSHQKIWQEPKTIIHTSLKAILSRVLMKVLVLHFIVTKYSIQYCVQEIKLKAVTWKFKDMIASEKGLVHTRNHLDMEISPSDYNFNLL